jgi:hypothetical protein
VKRLIAILMGVVLTLLLAPAASADRPVREFLPAEDFTLTGVCAFPVREEVTTNNEFTPPSPMDGSSSRARSRCELRTSTAAKPSISTFPGPESSRRTRTVR